MKKMFLSLATIAFVATGALTVTSCGSDDSTTPINEGDDNPGGGDSTFSWGGSNYNVDTTIMGYIGTENGATVYNIDTDGDEEGDTLMTQWIVGSYDGVDYQNASDLVQTNILVPVGGEGENLVMIYPQESETVYLARTIVILGGELAAPLETDQISGFDIEFNVVDEDNETVDYTTSTTFTSGTVSVDFDGALDGYYYFTQSGGKGTSHRALLGGEAVKSIDNTNIVTLNNTNVVKLN